MIWLKVKEGQRKTADMKRSAGVQSPVPISQETPAGQAERTVDATECFALWVTLVRIGIYFAAIVAVVALAME